MSYATSHLIQQQMYTRERRGIFRSTEGFDTVANSKGLDASFIKKVLHPLCVYDAPAALTARGEKQESVYPEAIHLVRTESGDVVLGRSIYKAADFTGLRSALFTHNYVIPAGHGESPSDYKQWLNTSFVDTYDIEQGTDLPELERLPGGSVFPAVDPSTVLAQLQLSEEVFKQLLYAVMMSAAGRKKVYVALNVPVEAVGSSAKQLLGVLYAALPYAFRNRLGFLTYAQEPNSRKGIHLMFVEPFSLRPGDRNVEKDFVFDLSNHSRILNVDAEQVRQPYFDWIVRTLLNGETPDDFFKFAEQMLTGMEAGRDLTPSSYHELITLYRIEQGERALYNEQRITVLRSQTDYLSPPDALPRKMRLNDLFLSFFDHEFDRVKDGYIPDVGLVDSFKDYYKVHARSSENRLVEYLIRSLNNAYTARNTEAVTYIYHTIEENPSLGKAYFTKVLGNPALTKMLFIPYMDSQMKRTPDAKGLLAVVHEWGSRYIEVSANADFQLLAESALMGRLRAERKPVEAVAAIHQRLCQWDSNSAVGKLSPLEQSGLTERLQEASDRYLLTEVELKEISPDQVVQIPFFTRPDLVQWVGKLPAPLKGQAVRLVAAYDWFNTEDPEPSVLDGLEPGEVEKVQDWAYSWLPQQLAEGHFARLLPAFYRSDGPGEGILDFARLVSSIRKWAKDNDTMYRFIRWSEEHPEFATPRGGFEPSYRRALLLFFQKEGREGLHKKTLWRQYFEPAKPVFKNFYLAAKRETDTPLVKTLRRFRKGGVISGIVLIVIAGTLGGLKATGVIGSADTPAPVATPKPVQQQPVEPTVPVKKEPTAIVTHVPNTKSTTKMVKLLFAFQTSTEQAEFKPKKLVIVGADQQEHLYENFTLAEQNDKEAASKANNDPSGDVNTGSATTKSTTADGQSTDNGSTARGGTSSGKSGDQSGAVTGNTDGGLTSEITTEGSGNGANTDTDTDTPSEYDLKKYPYRTLLTLWQRLELNDASTVTVDGEEYPLVQVKTAD
ncbi:GAP1-N2 domain-containing protein [Paenibacillus sp. SEL3]